MEFQWDVPDELHSGMPLVHKRKQRITQESIASAGPETDGGAVL